MTEPEEFSPQFRAVHYVICVVAVCVLVSVLSLSCAWEQVHTPTIVRLTTDTVIPAKDVTP